MTPEEQTDFAFIAGRLAELGAAANSTDAGVQLMAGAALQKLAAHVDEKFPTLRADFRQARTQANARAKEQMATDGPKLWADLHTRALQPIDATTERSYLMALAGKMTCGECRQTYVGYLRTNPPDFTQYFAWTVGLHNFVNAKLNKPLLALEDARTRWAKA